MPVNTRKLWAQLPKFMKKHKTVRTDLLSYDEAFAYRAPNEAVKERDATVDEANIITSIDGDSFGMYHRPVIDIDFESALIPSSTPGHYHLYIDKLIPSQDYFDLLDALAKVEIVQPAVAKYARERGYSAVRLPWISKDSGRDNAYDPTEWDGNLTAEIEKAERHLADLKDQAKNDPFHYLTNN